MFNIIQLGCSILHSENVMRDKNASLTREKAAHREEMLTSIGQLLRREFDVAEPVPDRLSDLVKELEQPSSKSRSK